MLQTTDAETDGRSPVREGEEQDPTLVRPAPALTDDEMSLEEIADG